MNTQIDFVSPVYNSHTGEELIANVDAAIASNPDLSARVIPFSSMKEINELISRGGGRSRKVEIVRKENDICLFKLYHIPTEGSQNGHPLEGLFFVYSLPSYKNIHVAISIDTSPFFHKLVLPTIRGLYPSASMTFITHKKMKNLLVQFRDENDYELIITRASLRERHLCNDEARRIIPSVTWPGLDLDETFQRVFENNQWFQSLEFEAKSQRRYPFKVTFTRQGVIYATSVFKKVFESFVLPVAKVLFENNVFFNKRSRKENPHLDTRPLMIRFIEGQFEDPSDNKKLIEALRRLRSSSVSVLHGNPYINLSVIDYIDGSTFDVWVLNNADMVIVPQLSCSINGLKRLINHVFDNYAEGDILEYKRGQA